MRPELNYFVDRLSNSSPVVRRFSESRISNPPGRLRKQPGREVVITDGPYLEIKEHIGGFWLLDGANMDEAVAWGRQAVVACCASVEVRQLLAMPTE